MQLAVTGANGFVGRHVIGHAARAGWDAVGIVRSEAASRAVGEAGGRAALLTDPRFEGLPNVLEGADAVVHLAQIGAERGGQTYDSVNIGLTERVLDACRLAGVPRLIYFSGLGVTRYGRSRRSTNRYFLSKLAAETLVLRSGCEGVVFRPSYVVGPGDAFVTASLAAMAAGEVERPGDGSYRMQPIFVDDVAALVLAAVERPRGAFPTVFDLVGPEALSYAQFLDRLADVAAAEGRPTTQRVREIPISEADERARNGGYQGMLPDELDCLLCDEVADPAPLEAFLGRPLTRLDEALTAAIRAA